MKVALVERFIKLTIQRQLVILFLFSFLIRLVFSVIFVQTRGIYLEADGAEYVRFAKCILDQGWMVKDTGPLFGSMIGPGYPMLVALNLLISGFDNFWFLILFQSIIGAMSVIVIYELAFLLSDSRTVALISGLWLALYIQYIWYTPWVLKETLVFFLFPFSVLLLIRIRKSLKPLSWDNIIFILTYSYLIHTDERYIAFLPLFAGYLLISTDHFKKRVLTTAIMLGGVLLCMIPWLYRNYIVYQRPVVISVRTTVITDKLLGYEPLWDRGVRWNQGINNYRTRPDSEKSNSIYKAVVDSLIAGHKVLRTEDQIFGINAIKKAYAEGLVPHAFTPFQRKFSYFISYWRPFKFRGSFYGYGYRYEQAWKPAMNMVSISQYGLLLPFFLFGIFYLLRKKSSVGIFILLVILTHTFIHTFLAWGSRRYRLPIDGFIIIIAIWAAIIIYQKIKIECYNINNGRV